MKKFLATTGALMSIAGSLYANEVSNSISIHNSSKTEKEIWINGEYFLLEKETSLWLPCLAEEKVEIQYAEAIDNVSCGEVFEVSN